MPSYIALKDRGFHCTGQGFRDGCSTIQSTQYKVQHDLFKDSARFVKWTAQVIDRKDELNIFHLNLALDSPANFVLRKSMDFR